MYVPRDAARRQPVGFPSMVHVLLRRAEERGDAPALHRKVGDAWEAISWRRYAELVERFGRALLAFGVSPGDPIAILSFNRRDIYA